MQTHKSMNYGDPRAMAIVMQSRDNVKGYNQSCGWICGWMKNQCSLAAGDIDSVIVLVQFRRHAF